MKKVLFYFLLTVTAFTACTKDKDLYDPAAVEKRNAEKELANAEAKLGVKIDPEQDWLMTATRSVLVTDLPSDIKASQLLIMDANPFVDNNAQVYAAFDVSGESFTISFEAPKEATVYAVCVSKDGNVRMTTLEAGKETLSFKKKDNYKYVDVSSASRLFAPKKAALKGFNELTWQNTVHSEMFANDGWADQWAYVSRGNTNVHFDDMNELLDNVFGFLPEGGLNFRDTLNKAEMVRNNYYAVVGEGGGEVTVTAIYRNTSNPDTRFGYYYFVPGEERNIKTVRKFIFEEALPMNYHNVKRNDIPSEQDVPAYKLVYYDANGNASYTFPEGTEIGFFNTVSPRYISGMDKPFNWYNEGTSNLALSEYFKGRNVLPDWAKSYNVGWETFSHTVMFQRGGVSFVCFEDWVQDFDMNDIVLMIDGNIEDAPLAPTKSCKENIKFYRYSYGFEDTFIGDYDMNDAVLRVWRQNLQTKDLTVELAATGAADKIYIYYQRDNGERVELFDGKEAHEAFQLCGNPAAEFYNTETINGPILPVCKLTLSNKEWEDFNYNKADFFIINKTKDFEVHNPAALGEKGGAPYAICAPQKSWKWPKEHICITNAYNPMFAPFAADRNVNVDWYKFPVEESVMEYDTAK